jgi:DNA-binding NtrC family response regulator
VPLAASGDGARSAGSVVPELQLMSVLLVIDRDPAAHRSLAEAVERDGHVVLSACGDAEALHVCATAPPDLVLLGAGLDEAAALELLRRLKQVLPRTPVILTTELGSMESAIDAMRHGAFDYVVEPSQLAGLRELVGRALASTATCEAGATRHAAAGAPPGRMVGQSPEMMTVFKVVGQAARSDVTVLIRGESGTGKELVARALHDFSARAAGPFVAVNCAAIPEALLESELFGCEKGAFTGATARRQGRFEQSDGGTILLDEVGDMAPGTQAKVLRILQDRTCERLGGTGMLQLDVRVLAATHRDLEQLVASGAFRKDLYYRLKVLAIDLPPLRERKPDIPHLAAFFLAQQAHGPGRHPQVLAPQAVQRLLEHDWPGNVRELESCIRQALVVCTNGVILPEHLRLPVPATTLDEPLSELSEQTLRRMARHALAAAPGHAYERLVEQAERHVLAEALRVTCGNLARAALLLGISRPTLRQKLERFGLRPAARPADAGATVADRPAR